MPSFRAARRPLALSVALVACNSSVSSQPPPFDASIAMQPFDANAGRDAKIPPVKRGPPPGPMKNFCDLPGAVVWSGGVPKVNPGGPSDAPDLTWLHVPDGFCTHYFATVPETRQLRFSPSGDLFVASPSSPTPGGASGGMGAIVVLPDDNGDGVADTIVTYQDNLPVTQGMLFYDGSFYYQNNASILKVPYANGDRQPSGSATPVIDVTVYTSPLHVSKALDVDDDGHIYVTNGGDQGEECIGTDELGTDRPFHGGVLMVNGTPGGELVARGLRNAIALRCAKGTDTCFGLELALDFEGPEGSREKLFPVRQGDDWGFPCCATANTPYTVYTNPTPDCSKVAAEEDSFIIDHTPFGLDFEEGYWTGTWKYRAFIALHGYFGSWTGARVLAIQTDPVTGWPVSARETDAGTTEMTDFATGWDDGLNDHGRPTAITFAPDGRLFLGDDTKGLIVWMAPVVGGG